MRVHLVAVGLRLVSCLDSFRECLLASLCVGRLELTSTKLLEIESLEPGVGVRGRGRVEGERNREPLDLPGLLLYMLHATCHKRMHMHACICTRHTHAHAHTSRPAAPPTVRHPAPPGGRQASGGVGH